MQRPKSAVSSQSALAGCLALGLVLWAGQAGGAHPMAVTIAMLLVPPAVVLAWAVLIDRVHRNPETGLDWHNPRPWAEVLRLGRVKLIGYFATLLTVGGVYALFRHYAQPSFQPYFQLLILALPGLLVLGPAYILWTTRYMTAPKDGLWHLGKAVSLHSGTWDGDHIAEHFRAWAIKGFFLAFLLSAFPIMVRDFLAMDLPSPGNPVTLAAYLIALAFLFDVSFGTFGYALALRLFNGHIRSANPYLSAWVAALMCYPPFSLTSQLMLGNFTNGGKEWHFWLSGQPVLLWLWLVLLVALVGIYAWATVAFGARFSNLTNRGIITHGPYAHVKHPAYLAKNSFWWLMYLPFLNVMGPGEALRNTILLIMVNLVYFWRAKTEERHLMADPAYVAYSAWIAEYGLVARLRARMRPGAATAQ